MPRLLSLHSFRCLRHEVVTRHPRSFHPPRTPITLRTTLTDVRILDGQASPFRSLRHFPPFPLRSPRQSPPRHPYLLNERILVGFAPYCNPGTPRLEAETSVAYIYTSGATIVFITAHGGRPTYQARSHAQQRGTDNRLRREGTAFLERCATRAISVEGGANPVDA